MSLGRKISADIVAKYKDDLLAVCIIGSTAKKLDRPYSDLEMFCILKDNLKAPPEDYHVYNGLMVQIEYANESKWLIDAGKVNVEWPWYADQYRNRIVLFEREGWLRKLDHVVAESEKTDFDDVIRIGALAMTESLASVRNADYVQDSMVLRSAAYWMAMDTAKLVLLLNRTYVRTTSWFWKQAFECSQQPKNFEKLAKTAAGFVDSTDAQRIDASEQLWKETIKLVYARGVKIESDKLID